ncbi:hypothetical protein OF83DRAFT_1131854 [Amylostereum chailletii]|nr:hypothetical protein OF83DRAFT_1131854 [Amylostereum chailletii]
MLCVGWSADFQVSSPSKNAQWSNGQTYAVSWVKGLADGVNVLDVELSRLSTSGLILVAKDVPATTGTINLALDSVPPADDYFLLFLNSTHGVMYGNSPKFSILAASAAAAVVNGSAADATKPTITLSGGPNPTAAFATTFPATNGALAALPAVGGAAVGMVVVAAIGMVGGAWTVL